MEEKVEDI